MNKQFEEAFKRIEIATGIKTKTELAKMTGTSQQYVSKKSQEGEFPVAWAHEIAKKYGLSTDWIMSGNGPKTLDKRTGDLGFYEELEEWARETGRTENTQWLKNQIESFFPMFTEWKKRRVEGNIIDNGTPASKVA